MYNNPYIMVYYPYFQTLLIRYKFYYFREGTPVEVLVVE